MTLYIPRREIVELAYFAAVNGKRGERVNTLVAEGRDTGAYSSCGDLLHCCAFVGGMRHPTINRKEYCGWQSQVNLSRWLRWNKKPNLDNLLPGDFILLDGDTLSAHGVVVISLSVNRKKITTADYGQPGGKIYNQVTVETLPSGTITFRGRRWTHHFPLNTLQWSERALTVGEWAVEHDSQEIADQWQREGKVCDDLCTEQELVRINNGQ